MAARGRGSEQAPESCASEAPGARSAAQACESLSNALRLAPVSSPGFRAWQIQSKARVAHSLGGAQRVPERTRAPRGTFSDEVPKEAKRVSHTELSFAFFR